MRVVYLVYSIAGWFAFGLLMAFWAGYVVGGRRAAHRRGFEVIAPAATPSPDARAAAEDAVDEPKS